MTSNRIHPAIIHMAAVVATVGVCALASTAIASADDGTTDNDGWVMTVDGIDYPVCDEEDCSDQPGQVGLWWSRSTQHWLLELGEGTTYILTP